MRLFRPICVAAAVSLFCAVLTTPTLAQAPSVLGIELGDPLSEAIESLEDKGCENTDANDLQDIYYVEECSLNGMFVTVAAPMDSSDTRSEAPVGEVTLSAYQGDVGATRVLEQRERYVDRWTKKFGKIEPDGTDIKHWLWETDSLVARIDYTTFNGNPHNLDVTLRTP